MYKPLILKSRGATIGLTLIVLIFLIAAFAPFICWFDPWDYSSTPLQRPSSVHPLGTNAIGQDILSELMYGARTSLTFGLSVSAISLLLSVLIGVYAGISGGIIESILMRITDVAIAIPSIVVIILVAAYLQPNLFQLILILSLLSWQYGARTFYAQTLSLKQRGYISAARNFGAGNGYLTVKHLIPDLYPIMLAGFIIRARYAIFMEAGLAIIGIFDPTTKSLGLLMHHAMEFAYMGTWLWWLLPPGILLALTILGFSLVGYYFEETIDLRHRSMSSGRFGRA
jgi:peptide/nickel transport system permease protein